MWRGCRQANRSQEPRGYEGHDVYGIREETTYRFLGTSTGEQYASNGSQVPLSSANRKSGGQLLAPSAYAQRISRFHRELLNYNLETLNCPRVVDSLVLRTFTTRALW